MCFSALDVDDSFALKAIEILGEAPAVGFKIMTLNSEHKDSVDFVEGVQKTEKVSWVTVCSNGEEVAERGGDKGGQLLFRE